MLDTAPWPHSAHRSLLRDAVKSRWFALPPELRAPRTLIGLGLGLAMVFLIAFYAVVDGAVQRSSAAQKAREAEVRQAGTHRWMRDGNDPSSVKANAARSAPFAH